MQTEDANIVTLIVSFLALAVSISSIIISNRANDRSLKVTIRDQMNNLLTKLNEVIIENVEMTAMKANTREDLDRRTYISTLVVQKASPLSIQARSLLNQVPEVMNSMDYFLTAEISKIAMDWEVADRCYVVAIKKGWDSTNFNKVTVRRGYATALFEQGKYDEGRSVYNDALGVVDNDSDGHKHMNGYTRLLWYSSESHNVLNGISSQVHYEKAKSIYASISNDNVRNADLALLAAVKSALPLPSST